MPLGRPAHEAVARDLGEYRRAGDCGALRIAADDGALLDAEFRHAKAVHEAHRVGRRDPHQRLPQGSEVGSVQSVRIDAAHAARHDHGPGSRAHDEGVELLPACLGELLRVVEARQRLPVGERQALEVEQDRRREQRSGEAAATGLVRTRDEAVAELAV
jgi:hypothetical protein